MTIARLMAARDAELSALWTHILEAQSTRFTELSQSQEALGQVRNLLETLSGLIGESRSADQAVRAVGSRKRQLSSQLNTLQELLGLNTPEVLILLHSARSFLHAAIHRCPEHEAGIGQESELEQLSLLLGRLGVLFFESAVHPATGATLAADTPDVDYALLYERMRQLAITDALTDLYNYGYFLDRLSEERARAERYGRLLSLILLDIDSFKFYNDTNGHPAGNLVLKRLAQVLLREAREVDIVARFGGEEFVLLVPEANRRAGFEMADRIRRRVAETHFSHGDSQPEGTLTISAGVATFPIDSDTVEELVQAADLSLYRAKRAGRNRVVAFEPSTRTTLHFVPDHDVARASLVGSFNNWDTDADRMHREADGSFRSTIALHPGTYRYKFVLDDHDWVAVSDAEVEPDHFGGENNILHVRALVDGV